MINILLIDLKSYPLLNLCICPRFNLLLLFALASYSFIKIRHFVWRSLVGIFTLTVVTCHWRHDGFSINSGVKHKQVLLFENSLNGERSKLKRYFNYFRLILTFKKGLKSREMQVRIFYYCLYTIFWYMLLLS